MGRLFRSISVALMVTAPWAPAFGDAQRPLALTARTSAPDAPAPYYWGTGFFVDWHGHILTANHLVSDCARVDVVVSDGGRQTAEVTASSQDLDLSLLHVPATFGKPAAFDTSEHRLGGAMVTVLGYSLLADAERDQDPSQLAARNSMVLDEQASQRLALVSDAKPGASGSPVIAGDGLVIGILQSMVTRRRSLAAASQPVEIRLAASSAAATTFLRNQGIAPIDGEEPQHARLNRLGELMAAEVKVECRR